MSTIPMLSPSAHARIVRLAALPAVHRAFQWLHLQELRIRQWQREAVSIPAPPFGEELRAAWFLDKFAALGLADAHLDAVGNALAYLRPPIEGESLVLLSAHLDTIFAESTLLDPAEEGSILFAPGASDNGAGLAALLALAAALRFAEITTGANILFAANVGEEAEGDLRGMRHLFNASAFSQQIGSSIALEGAGTDTLVSRGLGSRRFRIEITGRGGHAWTEAGTPSPLLALAAAVHTLGQLALPARPRTTINIGEMHGGTSVTAIPQTAFATVDIRSSSEDELLRCEVEMFRAVEDAVLAANKGVDDARALRSSISKIGDRPASQLRPDAPILATIRAVDRHLQLRTEERIGSTDANIPLALGLDAVAMAAGGTAGGVHTPQEWFDAGGRELALRRVLLVLLDLCDTCGQR